jgi:hypothetical protein
MAGIEALADSTSRHPELVSGSISPLAMLVVVEEWMLKQVQHDDQETRPRTA